MNTIYDVHFGIAPSTNHQHLKVESIYLKLLEKMRSAAFDLVQ